MVRADVATDLSEVLQLHPALRERSRTWQPHPTMDPVSTSPLVFHDPEPVQNGMLQVGDAATFVDPFIGDGISLALRSGNLGGECLSRFFRNECFLDAATAELSARGMAQTDSAMSLLSGVHRRDVRRGDRIAQHPGCGRHSGNPRLLGEPSPAR